VYWAWCKPMHLQLAPRIGQYGDTRQPWTSGSGFTARAQRGRGIRGSLAKPIVISMSGGWRSLTQQAWQSNSGPDNRWLSICIYVEALDGRIRDPAISWKSWPCGANGACETILVALCGWTNIAAPYANDVPYHTRSDIFTGVSSFEFKDGGPRAPTGTVLTKPKKHLAA